MQSSSSRASIRAACSYSGQPTEHLMWQQTLCSRWATASRLCCAQPELTHGCHRCSITLGRVQGMRKLTCSLTAQQGCA